MTNEIKSRSGSFFNLILPVVLCVVLPFLYVLFLIPKNILPFEDAAILMRYARHLGAGHGITWNIGESPVDGSTDFLYMLLLGGTYALGISIENGALFLNLLCIILTGLFLYFYCDTSLKLRRGYSIMAVLAFYTGPVFTYLGTGFGTAVFLLFLTVAYGLFLHLLAVNTSKRALLWFTLVCFICGLCRPEGFFLAGFMGFSVWIHTRFSSNILTHFFLPLALLGLGYLTWRYLYFDHLFPAPFYKKSGSLQWEHYLISFYALIKAALVPILILIGGSWLVKSKKMVPPSVVVVVLGFCMLWLFIEKDLNFNHRYQYPIVPLLILLAVGELERMHNLTRQFPLFRTIRIVFIVFWSLFMTASFANNYRILPKKSYQQDGKNEVGILLKNYANKRYTLLCSEAGLLPYTSDFQTVDSWGLNDYEIAKYGLSSAYIKKIDPDIIMFHAFFSPGTTIPERDSYDRHVLLMKNYAEANEYTRIAVYVDAPDDSHYYYVKKDLADRAVIQEHLSSLKYWRPVKGRFSKYVGP